MYIHWSGPAAPGALALVSGVHMLRQEFFGNLLGHSEEHAPLLAFLVAESVAIVIHTAEQDRCSAVITLSHVKYSFGSGEGWLVMERICEPLLHRGIFCDLGTKTPAFG